MEVPATNSDLNSRKEPMLSQFFENSSPYRLFHGDCLEVMDTLPNASIDMILCDLPYGCANCSWDKAIPFPRMWEAYRRILKPGGVVALFGTLRFGLAMIQSNPKWFRYEWILKKSRVLGFLDANRRPLRNHEFLFIFSEKQGTYNPQKIPGKPYKNRKTETIVESHIYHAQRISGNDEIVSTRFPTDILEMKQIQHPVHPMQKPVELLEYLVRTYTDPGEIVLDNTMGSGSTGVAALQAGRKFVGIEQDKKFFEIARERMGS